MDSILAKFTGRNTVELPKYDHYFIFDCTSVRHQMTGSAWKCSNANKLSAIMYWDNNELIKMTRQGQFQREVKLITGCD